MDITVAQIIDLIQKVGFPILLVLWFIMRTEKIIERNTEALNNLVRIEGQELEVLRTLTGKNLIELETHQQELIKR